MFTRTKHTNLEEDTKIKILSTGEEGIIISIKNDKEYFIKIDGRDDILTFLYSDIEDLNNIKPYPF
jgi:hypothetical protein